MYKCLKCEYEFEEPSRKEIKISNIFLGEEIAHELVCPECESDDLEELKQCEICHEWFNEDELFDTEGMLNGGVGYVCEQCMEDCDIKDI